MSKFVAALAAAFLTACGVETAGTVGAVPVWPAGGSLRARNTLRRAATRWTPASHLTLIPIETLPGAARRTRFAIVAPWRKPVYRDPEDEGT